MYCTTLHDLTRVLPGNTGEGADTAEQTTQPWEDQLYGLPHERDERVGYSHKLKIKTDQQSILFFLLLYINQPFLWVESGVIL